MIPPGGIVVAGSPQLSATAIRRRQQATASCVFPTGEKSVDGPVWMTLSSNCFRTPLDGLVLIPMIVFPIPILLFPIIGIVFR